LGGDLEGAGAWLRKKRPSVLGGAYSCNE